LKVKNAGETETYAEGLGGIELIVDLGLFLSPAEADKLDSNPQAIVPERSFVEGVAHVTDDFPDKVILVSTQALSNNGRVFEWLFRHGLFGAFGVTPERVLLLKRPVDMQHLVLSSLPACRHVISGNAEYLSFLAGLKPARYLFAPYRTEDGVIAEGILRGVFAFREWDSLLPKIIKAHKRRDTDPGTLASAPAV
jgi:hypothetical protein